MAVGVDIIRTTGRLVFELTRDGEQTTRAMDIAFPSDDADAIQAQVNAANATFTEASNSFNVFVQPANWRDTASSEAQWTTTRVYYESIQTITRPINPDV